MHPATVIQKFLAGLERAAFAAHLRKLRASGHDIAADLRFGPRVQITVEDGGRLTIGAGAELVQDTWLIVERGDEMTIGERVFVSQHCMISGTVSIGADSLIAGYVTILDANHRFDRTDVPIRSQGGTKRPVCIGSDVWIGASSVVLPGVTIGPHSIVGANSTVTRDIPGMVVAAGNPARVLHPRSVA